MKISVCGKGGSGKSTLVTLLANAAQERGFSVLVVDSDESNSGLFKILGFNSPPAPLMELVGGKARLKKKMRMSSVLDQSEIRVEEIPAHYTRARNGLVLVSIGKILQSLEGCACPMGVLSREFLKKLLLNERGIAFIDMEAGLEHFGRGIDESVDTIILVVEPSFESVNMAEKIKEFATGMNKKIFVVLNKMPSEEVTKKIEDELKKRNLKIIGIVPNDQRVLYACLEGQLLDKGEAYNAAGEILDHLLSEKQHKNTVR